MSRKQQLALFAGVHAALLLVSLPLVAAFASGRGVGLHRGLPASAFDPEQLRIGTMIEMEHTYDWRLAVQIARDHLSENKIYYTQLCRFVEPNEPKCRPLLAA